jgi:ATP-binding cassette subfamily F protein 3
VIVVSDVTVKFGGRALFEKLNLTVHAGQHVGVVGRNGVGKSTLFALLRRRLTPEEGEVQLPAAWRIAYLAQDHAASTRSAVDFVLDGDRALRRVQHEIHNAEAAHDTDRLGLLYAQLEDVDGYRAEARAAEILDGLGFAAAEFARPYADFSGGWRIRLNLAQTLMTPSDLMLLDEPTNHLDLDALLWLETWLTRYPGTLLTIAHDRRFLDSVTDYTIHVRAHAAKQYRGGYSQFERTRAEEIDRQGALARKQQEQTAHIMAFVNRFRAKASKARQVKSRLKALQRMEAVAPVHAESPYEFAFRNPERMSNPLLALHDGACGYDGNAVLTGCELRIYPGSRIGALGTNGAGKTTLMKTLAGELPLLGGELNRGAHSRIGYFAQHQIEQLDDSASALALLMRLVAAQPEGRQTNEQQLRDYLGGWGFSGDAALRPSRLLSGGERARLVLSLVAWQRPALLLLDEPTNHLDLDMREALAVALQDYEGAMVLVSHDRELLERCVDEYWLVANATAAAYQGSVEDYATETLARIKAPKAAPPEASRRNRRRNAAEVRRQTQALRDEIATLERRMERLASQVARADAELSDPATYEQASTAALLKATTARAAARAELARVEAEWLERSEQLEKRLDDA